GSCIWSRPRSSLARSCTSTAVRPPVSEQRRSNERNGPFSANPYEVPGDQAPRAWPTADLRIGPGIHGRPAADRTDPLRPTARGPHGPVPGPARGCRPCCYRKERPKSTVTVDGAFSRGLLKL